MGRKIGAVVSGVLVVGVVVFALQWISSLIHPLPPGVDPMDPADQDAFRAHLATMPLLSWALTFASEIVGAFLGALTAGKVADSNRRAFAGAIVAVALLGSVVNWVSFGHPGWFIAGQLALYPLVYIAVARLLPKNPYEGS